MKRKVISLSLVIVVSVGLILSMLAMWQNPPPQTGSAYGQTDSTSHFENTNIITNDFNAAQGIGTNSTHFFVADTQNDMVQIFRQSDGINTGNVPSPRPSDVVTNSTHFFVSSRGPDTVEIFRHGDTEPANTITLETSQVNYMAINGTHVFLSAVTADQVYILRQSDGELDSPITSGLIRPQGMATNQTHIFVADSSNSQVQILRQSDGANDGNVGGITQPNAIASTEEYLFVSTGNQIQSFSQESLVQVDSFRTKSSLIRDIDTNSTHFFVVDRDQVEIFENFLSTCEDDEILVNNRCELPVSPDSCEYYEYVDFNNECAPLVCPSRQMISNHECVFVPQLETLTINQASIISQLTTVSDVFVDSTYYFVGDYSENKVQMFIESGYGFVREFEVDNPRALVANSTHLFVVNDIDKRIEIFRLDSGEKLEPISFDNNKDQNRYSMTTNSTHLFLLDGTENYNTFSPEIKLFRHSDGAKVQTVTLPNNELYGIDTNSTHLFVTDQDGKILIYNQKTLKDPRIIIATEPADVSILENYIFAATYSGDIDVKRQSDGTTIIDINADALLGELSPRGIAASPTIIYVTDTSNRVIGIPYEIQQVVCPGEQTLENGSCVDPTCDGDYALDDTTKMCVSTCTGEQHNDPATNLCVDPICDEDQTLENGSCVDIVCPGVQIVDDATKMCVDPVPDLVPDLITTITDGVGGFDSLEDANDVAIVVIDAKTYAIVAGTGDDSVNIIDITDPVLPVLVKVLTDGVGGFDSLDYSQYVTTVVIGENTYALVSSTNDHSVNIIDITTPASPVLVKVLTDSVDGFDSLGSPHEITAVVIGENTYAIVAARSDHSVNIIDITTPASPVLVKVLTDSVDGFDYLRSAEFVTTVVIGENTYALVSSTNDHSVNIIDITTPASPVLVKVLTNGMDGFDSLGSPRGITAVVIGTNTYAIVANINDDNVHIIDITNPASPVLVTVIDDDAGMHDLSSLDPADRVIINTDTYALDGAYGVTTVVIGDKTYVLVAATGDDSLTMIDITTPASPVLVASVITFALDYAKSVATVVIDGNTYAIVAATQNGDSVSIIDLSLSCVGEQTVENGSCVNPVCTGDYNLDLATKTCASTCTGEQVNSPATNLCVDSVPDPPVITVPASLLVNVQSLTISGTTESGSTVSLDHDGSTLTPTVTGTTWSIDIVLTEDANTFTATATDGAGSTSGVSNAVTVTYASCEGDQTLENGSCVDPTCSGGQIVDDATKTCVDSMVYVPSIVSAPVASINNGTGGFDLLEGPQGITTVVIGTNTYALVTSAFDDSVTIIDITAPESPAFVTVVTDYDGDETVPANQRFTALDGPNGITTVAIDGKTYALVAARFDDGVQIMNITAPELPTFVAAITDGSEFTELDGAIDITTVVINDKTYALVAAFTDNGIQIINMTTPDLPTPVAAITDGTGGFDALEWVSDITTVVIGSDTYALVASVRDDGITIIDITAPKSPAFVTAITDYEGDQTVPVDQRFTALDGARGITTVAIDGRTYALVAAQTDDGVQIVDITAPELPTFVAAITDGDVFTELSGAGDITTVVINDKTYALVAAQSDHGVQIVDITAPSLPAPAAAIYDGVIFPELNVANYITTVVIEDRTYALVTAYNDDGVQIIELQSGCTEGQIVFGGICVGSDALPAIDITTMPTTLPRDGHRIAGTTVAGATVTLFVDAVPAGLTAPADVQGLWNFPVDLEVGENTFTVTATTGEFTSAPSNPVVLTRESPPPKISLDMCQYYEQLSNDELRCEPVNCLGNEMISDHECVPAVPTEKAEILGTVEFEDFERISDVSINATHYFVSEFGVSDQDRTIYGVDTANGTVIAYRQNDGINTHNFTVNHPGNHNLGATATNSTHLFVVNHGQKQIEIFDLDSGERLDPIPHAGIARNPIDPLAANSTHLFISTYAPPISKIASFRQSDGTPQGTTSHGEITHIATNSTHLFASDSGALIRAFDQNAPTDPGVISAQNVNDIAVSGDYLFGVSARSGVVQIFRQSDGVSLNSLERTPQILGPAHQSDNRGLAANSTHLFTTALTTGNPNTDNKLVILEYEITPIPDPTADAGDDQSLHEGTAVTLDGSGSDSFDNIKDFRWTQTAGTPVTLSDPAISNPTFAAPQVEASGETLVFSLVVTDTRGVESAEDEVVVTIADFATPIADAGDDQTVDESYQVTLTGVGFDNDGTIESYAWTQTAGTTVTLSDPAIPNPTFAAPFVGSSGETLVFSLVVTDNDGVESAEDTVDIAIRNVIPTADAGDDQSVHEGTAAVTLDGSGVDNDGTIESYAWTQTAGTPVTLSDPAIPNPTFAAPQVEASGETLVFSLVVTDDDGESSLPDTVDIVIVDYATPIADAGDDQMVNEGTAAVTLDGSGFDNDGTIESYAWTQTAGTTVTLSNTNVARPTFEAPQVGELGETLAFSLVVTDNDGVESAEDAVDIAIRNVIPTVDAGDDQTVNEDVTVPLDGSGQPGSAKSVSNSGLPPDVRVCGGVLCSEVINVPLPVDNSCGPGAHKVNELCVMDKPQAEHVPEPEPVEPEYVPEPVEPVDPAEPEYVPEPVEPEYVPEPTEQTQPANSTTRPVDKTDPDPEINQDVFTQFYNWITSIFG